MLLLGVQIWDMIDHEYELSIETKKMWFKGIPGRCMSATGLVLEHHK